MIERRQRENFPEMSKMKKTKKSEINAPIKLRKFRAHPSNRIQTRIQKLLLARWSSSSWIRVSRPGRQSHGSIRKMRDWRIKNSIVAFQFWLLCVFVCVSCRLFSDSSTSTVRDVKPAENCVNFSQPNSLPCTLMIWINFNIRMKGDGNSSHFGHQQKICGIEGDAITEQVNEIHFSSFRRTEGELEVRIEW